MSPPAGNGLDSLFDEFFTHILTKKLNIELLLTDSVQTYANAKVKLVGPWDVKPKHSEHVAQVTLCCCGFSGQQPSLLRHSWRLVVDCIHRTLPSGSTTVLHQRSRVLTATDDPEHNPMRKDQAKMEMDDNSFCQRSVEILSLLWKYKILNGHLVCCQWWNEAQYCTHVQLLSLNKFHLMMNFG